MTRITFIPQPSSFQWTAFFEHFRPLGSSLGGEEYNQAFAEAATFTPDQLTALVAL